MRSLFFSFFSTHICIGIDQVPQTDRGVLPIGHEIRLVSMCEILKLLNFLWPRNWFNMNKVGHI